MFVGSVLTLAAAQAMADPAFQEPLTMAADADGVQRATVVLDSYSYSPSHLIVVAGKPVELTLASVTTITPHNFVITDPASGLDINQDVGAGKTVVIRFVPKLPGVFDFYCDKKLLFLRSHREKGMEGKLDVR